MSAVQLSLSVPDDAPPAAVPGSLAIAPQAVVEAFPGPALLLDAAGAVQACNPHGQALAALVTQRRLPALDSLLPPRPGHVATLRVAPPEDSGHRTLDLTALGLGDDGAAYLLVLGREAALERTFINALVASRQLFKDLVACSADFAWETDADGTFSYVSGKGALGFEARHLYGRLARAMAHDRASLPEPFPFESRVPLDDVEVWLCDAAGAPACLLVSCKPVVGEQGEWLGARGVCRDVTQARARDAALAQARSRERLLSEIVNSMRTEVEAHDVLDVAVRSTAVALEAADCWVMRSRGAAHLVDAVHSGGILGGPPAEVAALAAKALDQEAVLEAAVAGQRVIASAARYRSAANGVIVAARPLAAAPWGDEHKALLAGVANHLGIAIAQIANQEKLEALSRTDELTGLLNRRAFMDEAGRRLRHLRRTGSSAALLYIDLDNFKPVNDVHGHARGDEALSALARFLAGTSRAGDLVARLGGDEFAMWLETTSAEQAEAKAHALLRRSSFLAAYSGDPARRLGLSIGLVRIDGRTSDRLGDLLGRADAAMYGAKRAGKHGVVVAESPAC